MEHTVPSSPEPRQPPVLLLGGAENAVSCARRFVRAGVTTVVVNKNGAPALHSRGVVRCPLGDDFDADALVSWLRDEGKKWAGSVLIPLSDQALMGMIEIYDELAPTYFPAVLDPSVVAAMLDKQRTVELAITGGTSVPRQWALRDEASVAGLLGELEYPLILKPRRNLELIALMGRKYLRADDEAALLAQLPTMWKLDHGFVLNEFLPGGDDLLSSYYAVRSPDGETLLEFTKRVDRRDPPNEGGATFHELVHLPATMEAGRKFFEHIRLVGMGNVEFKTDARTGELKLIECNHRLTAANALMQDNGVDVAGAVYDQALGRPVVHPPVVGARGTMWYPVRDLRSFRRTGDGIRPWLARPKRSSYPYFDAGDIGPSLALWRRTAKNFVNARRGA